MPTIQIAQKLLPILTTKKRIKVAVGGRGGSKSIAFADAFIKHCSDGQRLCCAREFQNSIDDSVHSLIKSRNEELQAGLEADKTTAWSKNGGQIIYKGLARNPESIKSMFGVQKIWVEEAQTLSEKTLEILAPTIRESNSELWFSANRGASKDPFSKRYLKPYEHHIEKHGFFEDEDVLIIQINWNENPFFPEVLNRERLRDKAIMSRAKYDHIWGGAYSDTVDNAIILPEWFDACVDSHLKLGFRAEGQERCSFDPADTGDAKAWAYMHGAVVVDVQENETGLIDTATDWATDLTNGVKPDLFTWDADGMGAGLKRQINTALGGKKIAVEPFYGGRGASNPEQIYQPLDSETKPKRNKEVFKNARAQHYWMLRDRMFKTWQMIEKKRIHPVDELISFSSSIASLSSLRSEVCRIPRKFDGTGKIQILSKPDMKKLDIDSPNMADAVMMLMKEYAPDDHSLDELEFDSEW